MISPSKWTRNLVLALLVLVAAQGLVNAIRPVIGWLIGLTAGAVVLAVVVFLVLQKGRRW
ncbi:MULTISPECIES: hypothetical protein [Kitasatospora]|uniref:Uncharacterized protein n=1 Tax=Kitasatospora setae (strain ATCC 33774 / DSM 43861 / JCM 3304 / KCC A-0304 / NBRC 14216 / KM-6054) TaxID=452652 RepID=E4NHN9_KITSK|nr:MULTISPECIES: hypothetical protein [Kitasatospora]BAJ31019.1 hypothetical protein KSE_52450 [Kitasatospora setae KM-6054]